MPYPKKSCPVYKFVPRISHKSGLLFPTKLYNVNVPPDLALIHARVPDYVSSKQMNVLAKQKGMRTTLGIVHGLTTTEFKVSFSNMGLQWKQVSHKGRLLWQFQGGNVYLDIKLNISILNSDKPKPNDKISQKIFSIIMSHELEHVLDEINIVSKLVPGKAYQDRMSQKYLRNGAAIEDRTYNHWFVKNNFSDWIKNGIWVIEHNKMANKRDSPANYKKLQDQIDKLRILQINTPR